MKKLFCAVLLGALTLTPSFSQKITGENDYTNPYTFMYKYKAYESSTSRLWICVYSFIGPAGGKHTITKYVSGDYFKPIPTCPDSP